MYINVQCNSENTQDFFYLVTEDVRMRTASVWFKSLNHLSLHSLFGWGGEFHGTEVWAFILKARSSLFSSPLQLQWDCSTLRLQLLPLQPAPNFQIACQMPFASEWKSDKNKKNCIHLVLIKSRIELSICCFTNLETNIDYPLQQHGQDTL